MISKISLALSVILTIAVIYLFVNRGGSSKQMAAGEIQVAPAFSGDSAPKSSVVAFVNRDSLNVKYNFIKEKSALMKEKMNASDQKIKFELTERKVEWDKLMAYAENNKLTPEDEMKIQNDLMRLQAEMEEIQKEETTRLEKRQVELATELQKRVSVFLDSYAKQRGIDYVFNKQSGLEIILYGSNAYDITNEVVAALNEEYAKEKSEKK